MGNGSAHVWDGIRKRGRKLAGPRALGREIGDAVDRTPGSLIHGKGVETHLLESRRDLSILSPAPTRLME